jgi:hypothetical protein
MNGQNPSGNIPSSSQYKFTIITAIVLSVVVSIKRVWLSFMLGRVTFSEFSLADIDINLHFLTALSPFNQSATQRSLRVSCLSRFL